ncbi:MAG TPA: ABC transporter permease [Burkholderiales bacterium]|nr:ABC transporter permease [Burkholderiales bacterium]
MKLGGYGGILRLAFKLLVNDRAKFSALLIGVTFAVFLMVQVTSMFAGILNRSSSSVTNIGASMWVMDPAVNTPANSIPMPDYVLDAVRSIDGVKYAVGLYTGGGLAKLKNGTYQAVNIVGLDDVSLVGRPRLEQGSIEDIYGDNAFIVIRDAEYDKLDRPAIGTEFELNDHRAVIVGVGRVAANGLFGVPTLYTVYSRAITYLPVSRFTQSYILVEPKSPAEIPRIKQQVAKLGYLALTAEEFDQRTSDFYKYQTGVGINIMIMTLIAFIVGLSISGQTFYTFILENLEKFGALKAIGAKSHELVAMILFQALFTGLTGYGLGVGISSLMIFVAKLRTPNYAAIVEYWNLSVAFAMVLIIAAVSSYAGVRRVLKIEPFEIFRG